MFLHLCVILFIGGWGWLPSMHHRSDRDGGLGRSPRSAYIEICIQGMLGKPPPQVWLCKGEGVGRPPRYMGYYEIRSISGQYASYWNASCLLKLFCSLLCKQYKNANFDYYCTGKLEWRL